MNGGSKDRAVQLADLVARGAIALNDDRIARVSLLARKLRATTSQVQRLGRLLTVDLEVRGMVSEGIIDLTS